MIYPVAGAFIYEDTQFTVYANDSVGAGKPLKVNVSAVIWFWITILKWVHFNPLNTKLNPICHLLALLGAHQILHVSSIIHLVKLIFRCDHQPLLNRMHQKKLDLRNSLEFSSFGLFFESLPLCVGVLVSLLLKITKWYDMYVCMYVCMFLSLTGYYLVTTCSLCVRVCIIPLTSFMSNCFLQQFLWTYRNDMICVYVCMYPTFNYLSIHLHPELAR